MPILSKETLHKLKVRILLMLIEEYEAEEAEKEKRLKSKKGLRDENILPR